MAQTRTDIIDDDADGADHEHERPFSEKVADAVALVMDEPGVEHIWLNAFRCISPTDEFAAHVGHAVIQKIMAQRSRHIVLRFNAS